MTATAFITDPALDPARDEHWPGQPGVRPCLELIEGAARVRVPDARVQRVSADPMVEIYRRRRFAFALALTVLVVVASQLAGISLTSFGSIQQVDDSAPLVHVIGPGDTYAGIAAELGADHPQSFASELRAANGNAELVTGQRLVVDLPGLGSGA